MISTDPEGEKTGRNQRCPRFLVHPHLGRRRQPDQPAIDGFGTLINNYQYDALNRTTRIEQAGGAAADKRADFGYNAIGQFTGIDRFADLGGTPLMGHIEVLFLLGIYLAGWWLALSPLLRHAPPAVAPFALLLVALGVPHGLYYAHLFPGGSHVPPESADAARAAAGRWVAAWGLAPVAIIGVTEWLGWGPATRGRRCAAPETPGAPLTARRRPRRVCLLGFTLAYTLGYLYWLVLGPELLQPLQP